jgi:hypothetical protein
VENRTRAAI